MDNEDEYTHEAIAAEQLAWQEYDTEQQKIARDAEYEAYAALMEIDQHAGLTQADWTANRSLLRKYKDLETQEGYVPTSWRPISALQYFDAEPAAPMILERTDGLCLIYAGLAHSFVGHFESMKSWAALLAVKDVVDRLGANAFYIDCESGPVQFWRHVKRIGIPLHVALSRIAYFAPREMLWNPRSRGTISTNAKRDFFMAGAHYKPLLIVIDGVTEFCALHGLDITQATDIALYQKMLLKGPWSGEVATLEVDHVAKNAEDRDFKTPLGSQHKAAGIDGAVFYFKSVDKGGHEKTGRADIFLIKDREGFLNDAAIGEDRKIGTLVLDTEGAHIEPAVTVSIGDGLAEMQDEAATLVDQILAFIGQSQPVSKRAIAAAFSNRGKKRIRDLIDMFEEAGNVHHNEAGLYELVPGAFDED